MPDTSIDREAVRLKEGRAGATREEVGRLVQLGRSYGEISAELGIAKSTIAYHARRIGVPVDEKASRRYDWAAVQAAYNEGLTMRECAARFGFCSASWDSAVKTGRVIPRPVRAPLETMLVVGRTTNRGHLKSRLLAAGLKVDRCESCTIERWRDKPLSLHLHHVNGDGRDNRLENLQLLCPNCHSQTDTYAGRNRHRRTSTEI